MAITRALSLESILEFIVGQSPKAIKLDPKAFITSYKHIVRYFIGVGALWYSKKIKYI